MKPIKAWLRISSGEAGFPMMFCDVFGLKAPDLVSLMNSLLRIKLAEMKAMATKKPKLFTSFRKGQSRPSKS